MKINMLKKKIFIVFLIVIAVFFIKALSFLDPDFGWHLTMGNYILSNGIPKTDPFSYTMPSYPFVDHEWLTNVYVASVYPRIGFVGLSLIFSLIAFAAIVIALTDLNSEVIRIKWTKNVESLVKVFLVLVGLGAVFPFFGIRPQIQSWLFLSILLRMSLDLKIWMKWRYIIPALFLIWVNLHGSYALGILILILVLVFRFIRTKKLSIMNLTIVLLSIVATFVNPYKTRVWWEVWMQITDTKLRWSVNEWNPAFLTLQIFFVFIVPFSLIFLWKYRKKFHLEEKALYIFLLLMGLGSARHIPLWLIFTLPLLMRSFYYFYQDLEKIKYGHERLHKALNIIIALVIVMFFVDNAGSLFGKARITEDTFYPAKAVGFIKDKKVDGNIFSDYGWGGYLIWKYPEKKVFIDGRMPSWRWDKNNFKESNYAMEEYTSLLRGKVNYNEVFEKYEISVVLLPKPTPGTIIGNLVKSLDDRLTPIYTLFNIDRSDFVLVEKLEEDNWGKVYEDNIAVIYEKS